ncbi:MAG: peptidylprolyl isomerase [Bacteroidales bacterium]|jgi:cyclophilin family peptidyl-prolyl cis-trans isomerase
MKFNIFKLLIILPLIVYSCKGNKASQQQEEQAKKEDTVKMATTLAFNPAELPEEPVFDILTTIGTIRIKLYKETPLHRDNFVKLASERFFDGILFHRVIKGFMIQTGDPLTKDSANVARYGTGGPGYTIPAEILPQFKHKKGALAAARRGDAGNPKRESSGSQFYLVEDAANCAQLDGDYTIFGETIYGIETIDVIAATPTNHSDRPLKDVKIISVTPVIQATPAK